jgi:phosphoribosylformylglycinamidine synthase
VEAQHLEAVQHAFSAVSVPADVIGRAVPLESSSNSTGDASPDEEVRKTTVKVSIDDSLVCDAPLHQLRQMWESTSFELEKLQSNPDCAVEEAAFLSREVLPTIQYKWDQQRKNQQQQQEQQKEQQQQQQQLPPLKVAILREEGSNGDREMAAAFKMAGFEAYDVTMTGECHGQADHVEE